MACNFGLGERELEAVGVVLDMVASTKRGLGSECMVLAVDRRAR